jgi:hypothetical protein
MKISKTFKKVIFFWTIFHLIGYLSYLTEINPSFKSENSHLITGYANDFYEYDNSEHFIFTPKYLEGYSEEKLYPNCYNCNYGEKENFWPFHKFIYTVNYGSTWVKGFVGVWGYYGHYEFLFYIVLPSLIFLLIWVYRRFVKD